MAAIAAEKEVFAASKTFTPIFSQLPDHIKLLGTKWVFKLKRDEEGRVARFKARLVAQGFGQRADDFDETFSPTLGQLPLRALIATAALKGLELIQADFTAAYLNPELDKNVLIKLPAGYDEYAGASALQLNKGMYGLHQSGALWNEALTAELRKLGYTTQPHAEQCVLVRELLNGRKLRAGL